MLKFSTNLTVFTSKQAEFYDWTCNIFHHDEHCFCRNKKRHCLLRRSPSKNARLSSKRNKRIVISDTNYLFGCENLCLYGTRIGSLISCRLRATSGCFMYINCMSKISQNKYVPHDPTNIKLKGLSIIS